MVIVMFQSQNGAAQSGNALVEYALIGALVAVVAIPALSMLGLSVNNTVSNILKAGSQHPTNQQANMPQATKPATQKPNNTSAITNGAA
ncbi:MAG: hypothetical protein K0Q50_2377, partial [Vampirovibrio sp.]|nr:hypothetical protein [Vampirovibrio sp.]